jgi:hypothetical protein
MNIKSILTWFGIVGSVASIISLVYIFIPQESKLNLSVQTANLENLTQSSESTEPEFKVQYKYKGILIKNLWKYNIRFINTSKRTLVGISNQKNILTDFLSFKENTGLEILDYKNVSNQFNHKLYLDSTGIKIYFEQWRPLEYLEYVFYVKAKSKKPNPILFGQLGFRQIVDGDITFGIEQKNTEVKRITQVIPIQGRQANYVISLIFTGLFIIIFTIFVFLIPFSYYKANKWYKKNKIDFIQFIHDTFPDKIDIQDKYILKPKDLPKHLWQKFKGEKFPNLSVDLDLKKFYQFVIILTIFIIIDLSLIVTFIDLIYFFP